MILDSLSQAARYFGIHPRLELAFAALREFDLMHLEPGRYEIDGDLIFLNLADTSLKQPEEARLEVHNAYLDVQLLLRGEESFGWSPRAVLHQPCEPFDTERDIQFFEDQPQLYYRLLPGQFTILLPEDAHAPLVGEGSVRKAILKVKL